MVDPILTKHGLSYRFRTRQDEKINVTCILSHKAGHSEAERAERAARVARVWRDGLSHKDWLFDGRPIRGEDMRERFANLDWDKAWIDLGPSIAGNLGPYWHVPMKPEHDDTVHRLYPKVMQSKWAMLILHACNETHRRAFRP